MPNETKQDRQTKSCKEKRRKMKLAELFCTIIITWVLDIRVIIIIIIRIMYGKMRSGGTKR